MTQPGDAIRELVERGIPFLGKLRLKVIEAAAGRARLYLDHDRGNDNYLGTVHAGALFTLGETAAGVAAGLAFDLSRVQMLAREATIEYLRPAASALVASSAIAPEEVTSTNDALERKGKTALPVSAEIADAEGEVVARMTVKYHFRKVVG